MRNDIATYIVLASQLYMLLIFVRVLFTWMPRVPSGVGFTIFIWTRKLTDPYLNLFRGLIPSAGGIDFSPIAAILVLLFGSRILAGLIAG